jgi:1-acyl-sn-glycerol-3-phosphate acyltransferase
MKFVYRIGYTLFKTTARLFFGYNVVNRERLKDLEGCMIASNHVSFMDPPMIGVAFDEAIYYLARKSLFSNPIASWIYRKWNTIPVNQARPELSSLRQIIQLLKNGEKVLMFPEGERSWDGELAKGKTGVGLMIAKSRARVLPVRIFGAEEILPRGASFPRRGKVTIVIGERFDVEDLLDDPKLRGKELYQKISDRVMAAIGAIERPGEVAEGGGGEVKQDSNPARQ